MYFACHSAFHWLIGLAATDFYRAMHFNAKRGIGIACRITSEEVVLQLIKSKCISSLLYGLDACALTKSELSSLDFSQQVFS